MPHSLVPKRYSRAGVSIVSLARLIIIVNHFIGVEGIRYIVSRIMLEEIIEGKPQRYEGCLTAIATFFLEERVNNSYYCTRVGVN